VLEFAEFARYDAFVEARRDCRMEKCGKLLPVRHADGEAGGGMGGGAVGEAMGHSATTTGEDGIAAHFAGRQADARFKVRASPAAMVTEGCRRGRRGDQRLLGIGEPAASIQVETRTSSAGPEPVLSTVSSNSTRASSPSTPARTGRMRRSICAAAFRHGRGNGSMRRGASAAGAGDAARGGGEAADHRRGEHRAAERAGARW
jgi:hypothetical protein